MSKLSFRARALDPSKPLNIHIAEELPDLTEYSAINRAVPQMPSGMEKEEESEHHLQRAICTGLIIPTPEVFDIDQEFYDRIYPEDFKISRQLIRMQPLGIEQDIPDYDMDSADEAWINTQTRRFDLTPLKFEEMMDRLEKSSGQTVVPLNEAKTLLNQDDEVSIAVYDYWLNKRLNTQHPLILTIKTENRAGSAVNNPYIAFRRRTEKMQTRKNRKNDETSYEKMLKLKRNLSRAVTLLEMIKRREKTKREHVHLGIEIFEKRYQSKDFNGYLLAEFTNNAVKSSRSAFAPLYGNQYAGQQSNQYWSNSGTHFHSGATGNNLTPGIPSTLQNKHGNNDIDGTLHNNNRKEKRQYKKRKHKTQREKQTSGSTIDHLASSDEDEPIINLNHLSHDAENEGQFPFKRNNTNQYHKPLINDFGHWPWESKGENGAVSPKYRFTLASIRHPRVKCIGFARRRRGRGGRIVLDRVSTNMDELWANLDYTILTGNAKMQATKEIGLQNDLQRQKSQADDIVKDKSSTSVVIDLAPTTPHQKSSTENSDEMKIVSIRSSENIVIKTEEKTAVTVTNECFDNTENRTRNNNNMNIGKNIDSFKNTNKPSDYVSETIATAATPATLTNRNNGSVNIVLNTDNNNNSGNNNNSSKDSKNASNYRFSNNINNMFRHPSDVSGNIRRHFSVTHSSLVSSTATASTSQSSSTSTSTSISSPASLSSACFASALDSPLISNNSLSSNNNYNRNHISDDSNEFLCRNDDNQDVSNSNQLYSELFGDWLHFRPKTPDDDFDVYGNFGEEFPRFAENTSLTVDIQRLTDCDIANNGNSSSTVRLLTPANTSNTTTTLTSTNALDGKNSPKPLIDQSADNTFSTNPFSYDYLTTIDRAATNATSVLDDDALSSSSSVATEADANLSGDSLPETSLNLGESEDSDKILDNLLEGCKFDDLKTINPNANFWNGLLDENGSLLDVIDSDKKQSSSFVKEEIADNSTEVFGIGNTAGIASSSMNSRERKPTRRKSQHKLQQRIGHSAFCVVNSREKENVFIKNDAASAKSTMPSTTTTIPILEDNASNSDNSATTITVKKELLHDMDASESTTKSLNTTEMHIKDEPIDDANTSNVDEQALLIRRQQIIPVIKTEIGNSLPIVSNTLLQRPITIQQAASHFQQQSSHQPHQQTFPTNDQTLILSSRPIRRLTATNGPGDGKGGIQHLLINRKYQMVTQRSTIGDDDKDVKQKILEGAYLKLPPDFNVVSSNAMSTMNASSATSKHNYSLPPQAAFHHHHQPITLIQSNQSTQSQNKVILNPSHIGSGNLTLATQSMQDMHANKITIPNSNIKLNIVPTQLAQVMQSGGGGLVIDAKSLSSSDQTTSGSTVSSSASSVAVQMHYQQSMQQHSQTAQPQQQQQHHHQIQIQQPKMKLDKTLSMMYDPDRNRFLYTSLKNNRNNAQFIAQINPTKVVNIVPIQHKTNTSSSGATVQGIGNKAIQRVVVSSNQAQNQQLVTAFRQSGNSGQATTTTLLGSNIANLIGTATGSNNSNNSTNNIISSGNSGGGVNASGAGNATGGMLIIASSSASDSSSIMFDEANATTISTMANSINTNSNSNQQTFNILAKATANNDKYENKLNHSSDGTVVTSVASSVTATVPGIDINTINR